jgi:hypothetical protein
MLTVVMLIMLSVFVLSVANEVHYCELRNANCVSQITLPRLRLVMLSVILMRASNQAPLCRV